MFNIMTWKFRQEIIAFLISAEETVSLQKLL